jgi:hypothetical protein
MKQSLFVVVWKNHKGAWTPEMGGIFTERRLAENLIECKKAAGESYEFAIVDGYIHTQETEAAATERLGAFV